MTKPALRDVAQAEEAMTDEVQIVAIILFLTLAVLCGVCIGLMC